MSEEELQQLSCDSKGDVINRDTLEVYGDVKEFNETFPCSGIDQHLHSNSNSDLCSFCNCNFFQKYCESELSIL